jgi:hypothetical protein
MFPTSGEEAVPMPSSAAGVSLDIARAFQEEKARADVRRLILDDAES